MSSIEKIGLMFIHSMGKTSWKYEDNKFRINYTKLLFEIKEIFNKKIQLSLLKKRKSRQQIRNKQSKVYKTNNFKNLLEIFIFSFLNTQNVMISINKIYWNKGGNQ